MAERSAEIRLLAGNSGSCHEQLRDCTNQLIVARSCRQLIMSKHGEMPHATIDIIMKAKTIIHTQVCGLSTVYPSNNM